MEEGVWGSLPMTAPPPPAASKESLLSVGSSVGRQMPLPGGWGRMTEDSSPREGALALQLLCLPSGFKPGHSKASQFPQTCFQTLTTAVPFAWDIPSWLLELLPSFKPPSISYSRKPSQPTLRASFYWSTDDPGSLMPDTLCLPHETEPHGNKGYV